MDVDPATRIERGRTAGSGAYRLPERENGARFAAAAPCGRGGACLALRRRAHVACGCDDGDARRPRLHRTPRRTGRMGAARADAAGPPTAADAGEADPGA